jgi:hypothetical protein
MQVDITVIRIAAESMSTALQFLVQVIQQDIGEQRGKGAALRCTLHPLAFHTSLQQPCSQVPPNEAQNARILDLTYHAGH